LPKLLKASFGSGNKRDPGMGGVSNFDVADLEDVLAKDDRASCAANQILYNPDRGIAFDLLWWCDQHHLPVMAYSPVGQAASYCRATC
jgi:diketogulonate reductase-like aldo/keto reductase